MSKNTSKRNPLVPVLQLNKEELANEEVIAVYFPEEMCRFWLDVKEFDNARVRSILASHGWFQTVTSDLPHFTYLGVKESELPMLGLKQVQNSGRIFWVPDIK